MSVPPLPCRSPRTAGRDLTVSIGRDLLDSRRRRRGVVGHGGVVGDARFRLARGANSYAGARSRNSPFSIPRPLPVAGADNARPLFATYGSFCTGGEGRVSTYAKKSAAEHERSCQPHKCDTHRFWKLFPRRIRNSGVVKITFGSHGTIRRIDLAFLTSRKNEKFFNM